VVLQSPLWYTQQQKQEKDMPTNFISDLTDEQRAYMHQKQEHLEYLAQYAIRAMQTFNEAMQPIAIAVAKAIQKAFEPFRKQHIWLHPSKQTRHFLATIHTKEHFTPVARPRKCSVRRMRAYNNN
jgi:hypothetical protein